MLEDYEYDVSVQKLNVLPATMGGVLTLEQEIEQERNRLKEAGQPPLTPIDKDWYGLYLYGGGGRRMVDWLASGVVLAADLRLGSGSLGCGGMTREQQAPLTIVPLPEVVPVCVRVALHARYTLRLRSVQPCQILRRFEAWSLNLRQQRAKADKGAKVRQLAQSGVWVVGQRLA